MGRRDKSVTLILEAAIKLFGERGYSGVSLDEIASESGHLRGLLLYYYPSKDALWRAAATVISDKFNHALHSALDAAKIGSDGDELKRILGASLDVFMSEPDFPRFLVREGGVSSERLKWLVEHFDYAKMSYGSAALRAHVTTTILRDMLFAVLLSMSALGPLMEMSLSQAAHRAHSGVHPMTAKSREQLLELLVRLIRPSDQA